jgi:DNA-binding GntR family transcriptional regulator
MPGTRTAAVTAGLPPIALDRRDLADPLYLQVSRHIEQAVDGGHLRPGDRLDGEIGLAEQLGISRQTMRRAIAELVQRGLLVRKHGVGTQVMDTGRRRASRLSSLHDELDQADRRPSTRVLSLEQTEAHADVAEALDLTVGTPVIALQRLRLAAGQPVAIMHNWLPADLVDLDATHLERRGLYQLLRGGGLKMSVARQTIGADAADAAQGRLLALREGAPVLTMRTVTYTNVGQAVDYGRHTYRPDRYQFEVTNVDT